MNKESRGVQRIYLSLTLSNTLAASFIWGINTLFLLDAGLSNAEAFAFFTLGTMLFEVPTGVVADTWGRRASYMIGSITLLVSTLLYLWMWRVQAPFYGWALSSMFLGLGFTFFSGATEAWIVDAMKATGYDGPMEKVFARGQVVAGVAMLSGSLAGGLVAQLTNLGVPYIVRAGVLLVNFLLALMLMRDLGFTPQKATKVGQAIKQILSASVQHGLRNRPVRWVMLAAPFSAGVGFYAFYAMQPYLLELYGEQAYGIAGLAAAIVAGAQIAGGLLVPRIRRLFGRRTTILALATALSVSALVVIGMAQTFWLAIVVVVLWALMFAATGPVRQAYLNGLIPSEQRATVLSFDSLVGSTGGVVAQPFLGRVADVQGYGASYLVSAAVQLGALPFALLARREKAPADQIEATET